MAIGTMREDRELLESWEAPAEITDYSVAWATRTSEWEVDSFIKGRPTIPDGYMNPKCQDGIWHGYVYRTYLSKRDREAQRLILDRLADNDQEVLNEYARKLEAWRQRGMVTLIDNRLRKHRDDVSRQIQAGPVALFRFLREEGLEQFVESRLWSCPRRGTCRDALRKIFRLAEQWRQYGWDLSACVNEAERLMEVVDQAERDADEEKTRQKEITVRYSTESDVETEVEKPISNDERSAWLSSLRRSR